MGHIDAYSDVWGRCFALFLSFSFNGDKANGIETFATKLGVKNASLLSERMGDLNLISLPYFELSAYPAVINTPCLGVGLLLSNYIGAMVLAFGSGFNTPVMFGVHAVLATLLIFRTWRLDAAGWVAAAFFSCNLRNSQHSVSPVTPHPELSPCTGTQERPL